MSEASKWLVDTDPQLSRSPELATTIHVAYWLTKLNDQQRIEAWTQAVEGLGEYVSSWQATSGQP